MGLLLSCAIFFPQLVSDFPLGGNRRFNQIAAWESIFCKGHMKDMDCYRKKEDSAIALVLYINLRFSSLSLKSNSQNGWLNKPKLHLELNAAYIKVKICRKCKG